MLTEKQAIDPARQAAQQQGWAWVEPAQATLRRRWLGGGGRWEVYSNVLAFGAKARIVLDAETGAVLDKGYIPR